MDKYYPNIYNMHEVGSHLKNYKNNTKVGYYTMEIEIENPKLPQRTGYIPKDQRKKILLLSDDARLPSGIGTMSREIILQTCHVFNWAQLGAAVNHPDAGKIFDASESLTAETGVKDTYLRIYPYNGYGDAGTIRWLLMNERPHAIMHFTDPRYWIWLYEMEQEIRELIPIIYYSIWDDLPYPRYNRDYYRSCDAIFSISKQTHNIIKQVVGEDNISLYRFDGVQHEK